MTTITISKLIQQARSLDLAGHHRQADLLTCKLAGIITDRDYDNVDWETNGDQAYGECCRRWAEHNNNTLGLGDELRDKGVPGRIISRLIGQIMDEFRH